MTECANELSLAFSDDRLVLSFNLFFSASKIKSLALDQSGAKEVKGKMRSQTIEAQCSF